MGLYMNTTVSHQLAEASSGEEALTGFSLFLCRITPPRPSLLNYTQDGVISSPLQKPMDLKQLKQRAAAIPPIVSSEMRITAFSLQLEGLKVPPRGAAITFFLSSMCRCPKRPCWLISTVAGAKRRRPHTLWLCTSSRSPWLTGSPLRRANSSSRSQASWGNSSHITRRQTETGTARKHAPAAPPAAIRTVRNPQTRHAGF